MSFARHKRDLARPVDIIGVGASQLGMVCDTPGMLNMTTRELWSWAASEALNDAGIPATEIEALFVGNMIAEHTEGQYHLPYVLAQWTGLGLGQESWRSAVRIEAACASSSQAIRQAVFAVASGAYDVVIAGGVEISNAKWTWRTPGNPEKMTNQDRVQAIYGHYDQGWEMPQSAMLDHILSQWLIAYAKRYGLSQSELQDAMDTRLVSNCANGERNPRAYWSRPLADVAAEAGFKTVSDFLRSPNSNPTTCWPVRRWDAPRRCDGAAAAVICTSDLAQHFSGRPIHYLGTGNIMQTSGLSNEMWTQPFIVRSGQEAFDMAGVSPEVIDIVEMYDYGPAEYIIPLEDLGVFQRGETPQALAMGRTLFSGDRPVNCSGGTTSGVAVGAVGAYCLFHLVKQLRGEAGSCQASSRSRTGLIYDCGAGRDAVIHILGG